MDDYETKLAAWKERQGVPKEWATDDTPVGELRMIAEDAKSTANSYCWMCADEFPIKDMVIETSPYNQMEEEAIGEDGYVSEENRVRKCKACVKREAEDE
jgi:hypothetical protein